MQLRIARLCLDCEEVHSGQQCPVCASETFAFLSRWVPTPERRTSPRQAATSPEAETYRRLTANEPPPAPGLRLLKRGVVGLTAVGLASWLWRSTRSKDGSPPERS
jgi:hypothetical protein